MLEACFNVSMGQLEYGGCDMKIFGSPHAVVCEEQRVYLAVAHPSTMSTFVGANAVASAVNGSGCDAALLTLIGG